MSRLFYRSGLSAANLLLRSTVPSASVAPKVCLLHTTNPSWMPVETKEYADKVRLGFIPEEWFQNLYKKTGVTGPYVFGVGLICFLLNKEIYVLGPETVHGFVALTVLVTAIKKYGPGIAEWADKGIDNDIAKIYQVKDKVMDDIKKEIESEEQQQWRLKGLDYMFDAQRENVALQQEIEYRERMLAVQDAVQKKMQYHIEVDGLKRKMEQKQLVAWVQENVLKSITPQQETDIVNECIANLKKMSVAA